MHRLVLSVMAALTLGGFAWASHRAASQGPRVVREERTLLGARCAVAIYVPYERRDAARAAVRAALDQIALDELRFSAATQGSETTALARAAGQAPIPISPDMYALLASARAWSERSRGAFDAGTGGLELGDGEARLAVQGARLDLQGIVRGFVADRAGELLSGRGFRDYLIDAGATYAVSGTRGDEPWEVPIPRGLTLCARAASVATRSDAGSSVTVTARADAEPLASALLVLGPERGQALLDQVRGAGAMWVDAGGSVRLSRGLKILDGRLTGL
jgi:thiamine biosynthesis lipoprotein ApbE